MQIKSPMQQFCLKTPFLGTQEKKISHSGRYIEKMWGIDKIQNIPFKLHCRYILSLAFVQVNRCFAPSCNDINLEEAALNSWTPFESIFISFYTVFLPRFCGFFVIPSEKKCSKIWFFSLRWKKWIFLPYREIFFLKLNFKNLNVIFRGCRGCRDQFRTLKRCRNSV